MANVTATIAESIAVCRFDKILWSRISAKKLYGRLSALKTLSRKRLSVFSSQKKRMSRSRPRSRYRHRRRYQMRSNRKRRDLLSEEHRTDYVVRNFFFPVVFDNPLSIQVRGIGLDGENRAVAAPIFKTPQKTAGNIRFFDRIVSLKKIPCLRFLRHRIAIAVAIARLNSFAVPSDNHRLIGMGLFPFRREAVNPLRSEFSRRTPAISTMREFCVSSSEKEI